MKGSFENQFEHEYKSWQSDLEFFRQKNVLLKYRLSEMVDNNEESHFLQMAEYFQNELLLKDEDLKKLISNVREFFFEWSEMKNRKEFYDEWIPKREKMRKNILKFEKEFLNLSNEFSERMAQKN
jgi:hypothetical protein